MNSIRAKVIFFDAVGTLFEVKGSVGEVYLQYAKNFGVSPAQSTAEALNKAFREVVKHAPPVFAVKSPEKLKQCERLWWFDVVHAVFYKVGMFEGFDDFFDEVFEGFQKPMHWDIFPETVGVLKHLKSMGFELGVISNFDTRFFEILRTLGLRQYFDSVTISSLAGAAKPAARIFNFALDQHMALPEEAVHVGDHEEEDFLGARRAGLSAFYLNRGSSEQKQDWVISDLSVLPNRILHDR